MQLKDKVVIVTGASDGIGKHISLALAKNQAKLALIARNQKRLQQVAQQAKKLGSPKVSLYLCDLTKLDQLKETVKSIKQTFGQVDVLINNAGIWHKMKPTDQIEDEIVTQVIATNLIAPINLTRLILPLLRQRPEAIILNVISKSGVVAQPGQSIYTASKYGLRGFTEVLKEELKDTNIHVAGVYQSGVHTDMFAKAGEEFSSRDFMEPADLANIIVNMLQLPNKIWIHDIRIDKYLLK